MKVILVIALLALFVSHTYSQSHNQCKGYPDEQTCQGFKNRGVTGWPICRKNANSEMWYYDTKLRDCKKLAYKGCGGNKNRFCTRISCVKVCKQPT